MVPYCSAVAYPIQPYFVLVVAVWNTSSLVILTAAYLIQPYFVVGYQISKAEMKQ
jgi:hypothetical protein